MKLTSPHLSLLLFLLLCFSFTNADAQVEVPFTPRYPNSALGHPDELRGNVILIGNNIVNRITSAERVPNPDLPANTPYNTTGFWSTSNDGQDMRYIDVDSDPTTFSSSSAMFAFNKTTCNTIVYAGLYWGAVYREDNTGARPSPATVKFQVPGAGYVDVTGMQIYDGFGTAQTGYYSPYVYYQDVTNLIQPLANPTGQYTVANVRASNDNTRPVDISGGISGGWNLVVVYQNPTERGRHITTYDGYAVIRSGQSTDIPYTGFTTVPVGPVNADIGVAVLEGDNRIAGDELLFKANTVGSFTNIADTANPASNFFNASISKYGALVTTRTPNSINTLGWDVDVIRLANPGKTVLPNGETGATFRATSSQDKYDIFFNYFSVEIIEPEIAVQKNVLNSAGVDIGNAGVVLGQPLEYVIKFQNIGNDHATGYTIRDPLPTNVNFNDLASNITLPAGVTYAYSGLPANELVFTIPDNLVEIGDAEEEIKIRVNVVDNCFELRDACSNIVQNLAYSTYSGVENPNQITGDPSVSATDACGYVTPGATNFLVDLGDCDFSRTTQLCGADVTLTAGAGFDTYSWTNASGLVVGTAQDLVVTQPGVYTVTKTAPAPCLSFDEVVTVTLFGTTQINPVIPFADDVAICPNDGDSMPKIFLCGAGDSRLLQTNMVDATSVIWEKFDPTGCTDLVGLEDCANKSSLCNGNWNQVATGDDFDATDAGEYRLVVTYNNGCFSRFYFKVYKNVLDPIFTPQDIICTTTGSITVTNVPAAYEYRLRNLDTNAVSAYQTSNVFNIPAAGRFVIEIRQQGIVGGCEFVSDEIGITERNFDADVIIRDESCMDLGRIRIETSDGDPQYTFVVTKLGVGGGLIGTKGPKNGRNANFNNISEGTYEVRVTTDDGCLYTETVTVAPAPIITGTAVTTRGLTSCGPGEITVTGSGGTPAYSYAIWSVGGVSPYTVIGDVPGTAYQIAPFDITTAGIYEFLIVDANNCTAFVTETIAMLPDPVYTTAFTDITCSGANDGTITINTTNSNGFSLTYHLKDIFGNVLSSNTSGIFVGLGAGNYAVEIEMTQGATTCSLPDENFIISDVNPLLPAQCTAVDCTLTPADVAASLLLNPNYTLAAGQVLCLTSDIFIPGSITINGTIRFCGGAQLNVGGAMSVLTGAKLIFTDCNSHLTVAGSIVCLGGEILLPRSGECVVTDVTTTVFPLICVTVGVIDESDSLLDITQDYTCVTDATIEVQNVTGGTVPYQYSIDGINFQPGTTFTGLKDGKYTITVRDANGCFITDSVTIDPLDPPTDLTFVGTAATCPAETSDVIVTVVDGIAPYTVEITAPAAIAATSITGNVATFNGLAAGETYTVRVTDAKDCVYTEQYTIAPVQKIGAVASLIKDVNCFNGSDGQVEYTVSNFTTTYNYTVTNSALAVVNTAVNSTNATINLTSLPAETYTITVTDTTTNCTDTAVVVVNEPGTSLDFTFVVEEKTCTADGSVTVASTGGWKGHTYSLTQPDASIVNNGGSTVFSGLSQNGTYTITVTDANNCVVTKTFTLADAVAPVLAITPNDICFDDAVGLTLTASVTSGGNGTYQYSLNGGTLQVNPIFTGLSAGTYTIDVIDGNNCTDTENITIHPELEITATATIISACTTTSAVTIIATGGNGTYQYAVVADGATPIAANYGASNTVTVTGTGAYDVYVQDGLGCDVKFDINITQDPALTISATDTGIACNGSGTTVTITAGGGSTIYEYSIDNGVNYQPSPIFVNVPVGNHALKIRDSRGCEIDLPYAITEPFSLSAAAAVTELIDCTPLLGAEVRITNAFGGTAPYSYSFDGGANYVTGPGANITHLMPGTYNLFIRDANMCTFPMSVTVTPALPEPDLTSSIDYECDGEGTVTITNNDGSYTYTYSLNGAPSVPSNIFNNIPAGSHTITVGYRKTVAPPVSTLLFEDFGVGANTAISEIDPLYCYEPQNGTVNSCGWAINSAINDGEYSVTNTIANPFGTWLNPNDHTNPADPNARFLAINVGGVAGVNGIIYAKRNIEVIANRDIKIKLSAFNLLRSTATGGDPSVVIELVDAGGTVINSVATGNIPKNTGINDWHDYEVDLNPGANSNLDIVIRTQSAVIMGNDIAIDDITATQLPLVCDRTQDLAIVIEAGKAFAATVTAHTAVSCNGAADGTLTFEVDNFDAVAGFEYSTDAGATFTTSLVSPVVVTGLSGGATAVIIRDVTDITCNTTLNQNITEAAVLVANATITTVMTCNTGATLTASATGGTLNYEYQLEDNVGGILTAYSSSAIFNNITNGDYVVRVRDANLCTDDFAITVTAPDTVTFTSTATNCYAGASNGTILVSVATGNGGYQYSINGGAWVTPGTSTHTFTGLTAGSYTIDVKDSYGCDAVQETVEIDDRLLATVTTIDVNCIDGSISVAATGGDNNYVYAFVVSGNAVTAGDFSVTNPFVVTNATAGTYDVYVRDNGGGVDFCEYTETVTVNTAPAIAITATPTAAACHDDTGNIQLDITAGDGPFNIQLTDVTGAGAGDVTVSNFVNTTRTFFNLIPGDYTIAVTDKYGCNVNSGTVTIINPVELTATYVAIIPPACNYGNAAINGIEFTGYTTVAGLTTQLSIDGGTTWTSVVSPFAGNVPFTGHVPGETIFPAIRTINGSGNQVCIELLAPYKIEYPLDNLFAVANISGLGCTGGFDVTVLAYGASGNALPPGGTYQFSYDLVTWFNATGGAPPSITFTGLIPGRSYDFYVRDTANPACIVQNSDNIYGGAYTPDTVVDAVAVTESCFGVATGEITFTVEDLDGIHKTQGRWELFEVGNPVAIQNSGGTIPYPLVPILVTVPGLGAGTYYLVFTEVDGAGADVCFGASEDVIVQEAPAPITGAAVVVRDITCDTDGALEMQIVGGWGGYTYTLTTANNPNLINPITGTTDNPIIIAYSNLVDTTIASFPLTVDVTDRNGCSETFTTLIDINVAQPPATPTAVAGCTAPYTLTVTNGGTLTDYLYSIDGGTTYVDNSGLFTGLVAASYDVVLKEKATGCESAALTKVIQPALEATVLATDLLGCTVDGGFRIAVTEGSGNYNYTITGPGVTVGPASIALPSNPLAVVLPFGAASAGTYTITIIDNDNVSCPPLVKTIEIDAPIDPVFTVLTPIDVTCNGASDGSFSISEVDNGINPLTYTIAPAVGTWNPTTLTFSDLPPSTYTVTGTGVNGCTFDRTVSITQPPVLSVPVLDIVPFACTSGNTVNQAEVSVNVGNITGGSGTYVRYEFVYDNGTVGVPGDDITQIGVNTSMTITNIAGGFVTLTVFDSNGCSAPSFIAVPAFVPMTGATVAVTPITCATAEDIAITVLGGSGAYSFTLTTPSGVVTTNTTGIFTGLTEFGTHTTMITDTNTGCVIPFIHEIEDPNTFNIVLTPVSDVICFGGADGEVTISITDATYVGGFTWTVRSDNGTPANYADDIPVVGKTGTETLVTDIASVNGLLQGGYSVEVIQTANPFCPKFANFIIAGPSTGITANTVVTPITCNGNDGSIEIINAAGGWGGFQYFVAPVADPAPTAGDYVIAPKFDNLGAGTYQVWLIDQNGCPEQLGDEILVDPIALAATLQVNQFNCNGTDGILEVVAISGGQGSNRSFQLQRFDGATFVDHGSAQTTTTFTGLAHGRYRVVVSDQWTCTISTNEIELYEEMNLSTAIVKEITCNAPIGGEITVNVVGGSTNLQFDIVNPDTTAGIGNTTGIFTGLTQVGTYTFTVTDLATGSTCTETITADLEATTPVTFTVVATDVSCNGGSDGTLTVNLPVSNIVPITNNNPVYTYEIIAGPITVAAQNNPVFSGLAQGTYTVRVHSGKGCFADVVQGITEPIVLGASGVPTSFACAADNTIAQSTLVVVATGGTIQYSYSIDGVNFQNSDTFLISDTGVDQNLTITVKDDNGCEFSYTETLVTLPKITAVTVTQDVAISCAPLNNGEEVTVTVAGGSGDYTFDILPVGGVPGTDVQDTAAADMDATYTLTTPGTYVFRVTDDLTGCYFDSAAYTVAPYDTIDVIATPTQAVMCFGNTDGAITINVTGYTGAYTFEVFESTDVAQTTVILNGAGDTTVANPLAVSGFVGGSYVVVVTATGAPFCSDISNTFTIDSPGTALSASIAEISPVTCTNDIGEIQIDVTGGYAPYTAVLTGGATTVTETGITSSFVFTGLGAGTYTATVTDREGCLVTTNTVTLIAPTPISAGISTSGTLQCFGDTSATVTATAPSGGQGIANFVYYLNTLDAAGTTIIATSGPQSGLNFTNVGAGIYSITVRDGWNCEFTTATVTITEPTPIKAAITVATDLTCDVASTGSVTLTASGGSGTYEFSTDGGATYTAFTSGHTIASLIAGSYSFHVRDASPCSAVVTNTIELEHPLPAVLNLRLLSKINCVGETNGIILATATGGVGNYEFELTGTVARPRQTSGEFKDLPVGNYTVMVYSGTDCDGIPQDIELLAPPVLTITTQDFTNETCPGENDGTITIDASNSDGSQILYAITPTLDKFDTKNQFTDLTPGDYRVIVQNENGCFEALDFTILPAAPIVPTLVEVTPEVCVGEANGTITISIAGGIAPYSTSINSMADADFVADRLVFDSLAGGSQTIFVKDANDCIVPLVVAVPEGVNIRGAAIPIYVCDSNLPSNSVTVELEDDTIPTNDVLYALDSTDPAELQLTSTFENLAPGSHFITIAHINGCTETISFEIESFEPLIIGLQQGTINEIKAVADGGKEDYTYFFNGENTGNKANYFIHETGIYTVTVIDANGCEATEEIFMEFIDIKIPDVFTPNGDGLNDGWKPKNQDSWPEILTKVYDRYGRVVAELNLNEVWNGMYKGTELPTGDYWYILKLNGEKDDREFVGHFTLYR